LRKLLTIVSLLLCLFLPVSAFAAEGDELLYNADFSNYSEGAALPAGWELQAYQADAASAAVVEENGIAAVRIENISENDARVVQRVSVQPDTVYRLSGKIRTEDVVGELGASLSIDNYGIDETYCYSEPIFGTKDWQDVSLYLRTGSEQNTLAAALRIGGYSMEASGVAWFSELSLTVCEDAGANLVLDLSTETGLSYYTLEEATQNVEPQEETTGDEKTPLVVILLVSAAAALLLILLYVRYLQNEAGMLTDPKDPTRLLTLLFTAAVLLRIVLSVIFVGHSTDINCFMAWGNAMMNGPAAFYTSGMFADYPPGYMYVLWALTGIAKLFGMPYGSAGYVLLFKLPATIADICMAYFLYRIALEQRISARFSLVLAALVALHPVGAYISGAWGQIDSILGLGMVLVCRLFLKEKRVLAGSVYGLVILFKPQALMLGPILAVAYIADIVGPRWKERLTKTVLAVISAFAVILLLALPFQADQGWDWLVEKYFSTIGSYAYASIEAFNFFALFGGNWKAVASPFLGASYQFWGTVFIVLSVLSAAAIYLKGYKKHGGALYLSAAYMLTMIFTFGHYMHERYLFPVLFLLLAAYVMERDRRILFGFSALSVPLLLNVLSAMYIVDHQTARGVLYDAITTIGSLLEVLAACCLACVVIDLLVRDRVEVPKTVARPIQSVSEQKRKPILPTHPIRRDTLWTKQDRLAVLLLTLVYAVFAVTNLGTLKAPETAWETSAVGETVRIEFGTPVQIAEYRVFSNLGSTSINPSGTILLSADGFETTYEQNYDNMFRWDCRPAEFTSDYVEISLYQGQIKLNEIAFMDTAGECVPMQIVSPVGTQAALIDEQDTVPKDASSYNGMYFDELYHARTAYEHLNGLKPYENSHPPLGKLLIAFGIALFGMNPFGWRIVGALIGVAMLPILYAFGKRMFRRTDYAFVLTALFAFDFMHFTQTRIATIDVYAVFFILLMYWFMYRYIEMNFFVDRFSDTLKPLALAGVFFGFGAASKWICIYAGGGLAVLFFGSLLKRYDEYQAVMDHGTREEKQRVADFDRKIILTLLWCVLFYIVVPFAIYALSYLPYYLYEAQQMHSYGLSDAFRTLWNYQEFMFGYHSGLKATHPYQSSWWQWPFTLRPMWYYFKGYGDGTLSTLTASGNPAVWWIGTIGALVLLVQRLLGNVKEDKALQILCIGVLANFLPWVLVPRCTFIYHFFATVPFVLMAAVYALWQWEERDPRVHWVKWVWLGLAILLFLLLYPGISGLRIPTEWAALIKLLPGGGLMYGA